MSIQIIGVSHIYNKQTAFEKKSLKDINLEIKTGEFVGLIGHTGSGKSTLIQHLNALIKPSEGKILIDGEDIATDKKKLKALRCKVGLVFQYPEYQLFETTIYRDVCFGPENMGLPKEEVKKRAERSLQLVGITEELYEKSPFELSGGQKRRVAIAGVLAMEPTILILDEPAAGLDPKGRDEILEQIKKMHEELGITVILVSHSMEDVARLVQRLVVMNKGRIAFDGTPETVFENIDELEQMGLAAPQVTYLMKALQKEGFSLPNGIFTVGGAFDALKNMMEQM